MPFFLFFLQVRMSLGDFIRFFYSRATFKNSHLLS